MLEKRSKRNYRTLLFHLTPSSATCGSHRTLRHSSWSRGGFAGWSCPRTAREGESWRNWRAFRWPPCAAHRRVSWPLLQLWSRNGWRCEWPALRWMCRRIIAKKFNKDLLWTVTICGMNGTAMWQIHRPPPVEEGELNGHRGYRAVEAVYFCPDEGERRIRVGDSNDTDMAVAQGVLREGQNRRFEHTENTMLFGQLIRGYQRDSKIGGVGAANNKMLILYFVYLYIIYFNQFFWWYKLLSWVVFNVPFLPSLFQTLTHPHTDSFSIHRCQYIMD